MQKVRFQGQEFYRLNCPWEPELSVLLDKPEDFDTEVQPHFIVFQGQVFDKKQYVGATAEFELVEDALDDPEIRIGGLTVKEIIKKAA